MTTLRIAHRRAEEFARAVDTGAAPRISALEGSLALVGRLRAVEPADIDATFRDELRRQLMAAAIAEPQPAAAAGRRAPVVRPARAVRRGAAVVAGLLMVGGATGVAAASQSALPGEALYPVKRALEGVSLRLADGPVGEGTELLAQATTRLDEADRMVAGDPPATGALTESVLIDFDGGARRGGGLLLQAYRASGDESAVTTLRGFTSDSAALLTDLATEVPPVAGDELSAAIDVVNALDARALRLCPTCADELPPLGLPAGLTLGNPSALELLDRVDALGGGRSIDQDVTGPPGRRGQGGQQVPSRGPGTGPAVPGLPPLPATPGAVPGTAAPGSPPGGTPGGPVPTLPNPGVTVTAPPVPLPTVTVPPVPLPTVTVPPVPLPTVTVPPVTLPTVALPTGPLPTLPQASAPLPTVRLPTARPVPATPRKVPQG